MYHLYILASEHSYILFIHIPIHTYILIHMYIPQVVYMLFAASTCLGRNLSSIEGTGREEERHGEQHKQQMPFYLHVAIYPHARCSYILFIHVPVVHHYTYIRPYILIQHKD